jgi:hypothetical protein
MKFWDGNFKHSLQKVVVLFNLLISIPIYLCNLSIFYFLSPAFVFQ